MGFFLVRIFPLSVLDHCFIYFSASFNSPPLSNLCFYIGTEIGIKSILHLIFVQAD